MEEDPIKSSAKAEILLLPDRKKQSQTSCNDRSSVSKIATKIR